MAIDITQVPVELWDIGSVKPYPFNNKKHPEKHIELLSKSLKTHGLMEPLVLDENGVIIAGHGRHLAMQRLEYKKVPVRVLRGISEAEASALRIASNKTVWNEYDTEALTHELALLKDADFDLSGMGFDDKELSMLVHDMGEIDVDIVIDDMTAAVEKHEQDISEKAEEVDDQEVNLTKAFGFKTIPLKEQKYITRFMAEIEAKTGKSGVNALLSHVKGVLAA